jgi:hypothetical protein
MVVYIRYTQDAWVDAWAIEVLWNICVLTAQSYVSGHRLAHTKTQPTKVNIHNEADAIPKMLVSYGWSMFPVHIGEHSSGQATTEFCYIKKHKWIIMHVSN